MAKPTPQATHGFSRLENGKIFRNATTKETGNLTKNKTAAQDFFDTISINTDILDQYETGLDFLSEEEYQSLAKRGLFSWIVEAINAILNVSSRHRR